MLAEREAMIGPARVPLGVIDAMRNVSRVVLGEIDPSHGTCVPSGPRMACHGAPSQRPSKLSQACWCVFPWPCGKFDRVKNSPRRIQVVRVPVLAGPTEKCGHLVLRSSLGRAEASSVTRSARKVVALGEAFTGISLARRGQAPNHPEVHYGRFIMVEAKARPCLTRSATSLQSPRPSEKCALLRCRPGLTVPRWVVWHIRSTEGQVPKHPEVHSGRFNAVEAKARPWLKQSATSLQSPRPSEMCALLRFRPGLTVSRWVVWHIRSTEGQVPKHPEVHSGRFSTVEAEARPRLKQSATSLQSPRPSEMCALLRCRPGLTVSRWVVVGIPRTCRGFSCGPFYTEGCGARCCLNGHSRSTKGQVSKHPEVHFWRLNMVEAMAR
ncbi:hypothetical protein Lal_00046593 [Lupinus albus]|nr:hypothetical protein Lal_00046602 [Lupinus albus]KAF1856192.1 hypothetical protein Lal_00046593 [Lupinus albus]